MHNNQISKIYFHLKRVRLTHFLYLNLTLLIAFDVDIKKVTLMIDTEQLTACISMQEREF
jgi:hypothetical protein